jgi:ABC-type glycerol-3-phosphate transport system permease component
MAEGRRFWTLLAAAVVLLFTAGPVVLAFTASVIPNRVLFNSKKGLLDEGLTVETYRYIFTGQVPSSYLQAGANRAMISDAARQVPQGLWNSLQISLTVMVVSLVLAAPAAFVYGRYDFPLKTLSYWFILLSPLMPAVALLTPVYMMIDAVGLLGTKAGIVIIHTVKVLPFIVLILSVFFRKMPNEIFEAAVIDGCSRFECFRRIAIPLALPSIAATGLFAFMLSYSEYMYAFVMSGDDTTRPISVVMAAVAGNFDVSWSLLNTAIFIAIVPTTILVVLTWRYLVEDLVRGAVKG